MLKKELTAHLRSLRITRRGKTATTAGQPRGRIIDAVSIREKPAYIESHAVPGQSEDDLLLGARDLLPKISTPDFSVYGLLTADSMSVPH